MAISQDAIIQPINDLLAKYGGQVQKNPDGTSVFSGSTEEKHEAETRVTAAIERYSPADSSYRAAMKRVLDLERTLGEKVPRLLGVLRGLRDDYAHDYMETVQELVHRSLFADFLDMAAELQHKGFKDPAAVLTGSVLEGHLRKLAEKSDIAITNDDGKPRTAESINTDLGKQVYGVAEQKQVTAWLALRNHAAHGEYDKFDHPQVALMIQGVRDFLIRHRA